MDVQRSSAVTFNRPDIPQAFASIPAWVRSAPFGKPVVPDVYCSDATASGETSGNAVALAAPAAINAS